MKSPPSSPNQRSLLKRWLWEPLVHFFVLGLVVFGLYSFLGVNAKPVDDPLLVEVTSAEIEWFRTMWHTRMGRQPTTEELRGQVNQFIREQILSREAVAMGLDTDDTVVRRRLAQKMDFLFKDLSAIADPSESELRAYLRGNRQAYETPRLINFTQIYFNADKRGPSDAAQAAKNLIAWLNKHGSNSPDLSSLGDALLLPARHTNKPITKVRDEFGERFAREIWQLSSGKWQGPVTSGYGLHAVYVQARTESSLPAFGELAERLKMDWLAARERELAAQGYLNMRTRYQVLVEGMPYDLDVNQ